jgi:small conductance mechanosensitive channel
MVNGQGGLVEELKLRTIVLRDEQGAVHIFPNGEVKTLSNLSKDFSYYVITIGVGFDDDVERATDAMVDAATALMREPEFMPFILAPLEVLGVDSFEGGQLVIKARIKTVPLKQWLVGRELRRRIVGEFKTRGIRLPAPRMVVDLRQDKSEVGSRNSEVS